MDNPEAGDTIVPTQLAIAIYENQRGEIVIRQEMDFSRDEDSMIVLHKAHLHRLIAKLQEIQEQQ